MYRIFRLFSRPDDGSGTNAEGSQPPATPPADEAGDKLKALEAERTKLAEKLAAFEREKAEREKAEADKQKSLEQRLAEAEAERKQIARKALIADVRLKHGFSDPVFEGLSPEGEDEEAIKAFYAQHKARLDEYVKAATGKPPAQGEATGGATKPDSKPEPKRLSLFERAQANKKLFEKAQ